MPERVFVVGVGMTRFCKPQKKFDSKMPQYPEFAQTAVKRALDDCGLTYKDVEAAAVGSVFDAKGQRCLYEMGMTGIPIHNVSNACATGSNALYICRNLVAGGLNDCTLALGIEIMQPGPLGGKMKPGPTPFDGHMRAMMSKFPIVSAPMMPQMFGNAGREHATKYGSTDEHLAKIASKNHKHSLNNPYSQFRTGASPEQVLKSPMVYEPGKVRRLMCSPTSDGAGAAIVCSESFVKKHGLEGQAIEIIAQTMKTDMPSAFKGKEERTCINMVGYDMAQSAAAEVYKKAGIGPDGVQVVELHDCFAPNELITYESLGLAKEGEAHKLVDRGDNTYGGKWVINPSGGLESKGHPLGATGLAQCAELNWQLRGEAGPRQVQGAKVGLQHNLGLGGAVVVTMYQKPQEWAGITPKRKAQSGAMGFGEKMMARL